MRQRARPHSEPIRRLLARWTSRKVRCCPAQFAEGMERLDHAGPLGPSAAEPAASVTTATSPSASACRPSVKYSSGKGPVASITSPAWTSSIVVLAGRRFCARPIRPSLRSARICSCSARSKPFSFQQCRQALSARTRPVSIAAAGGRRHPAPRRPTRVCSGWRRRIYPTRRGAAAGACANRSLSNCGTTSA